MRTQKSLLLFFVDLNSHSEIKKDLVDPIT